MSNRGTLESTTLTERLVLLAVLETGGGTEPTQAHELCRTCRTLVEKADEPIVGTISEADVIRALYSLEAEDVVEESRPEETSPVGKGRPSYELAVEEGAVLETVRETPVLEGALEDLE